jgi:hypothetical protein
MICYVAFFATLLGSAGVYFYGDLVDRQLEDEVIALNNEISSFSETDMQRVREFDLRLQQANDRLNKSASIVSIFNSLEAATINTVSLNSLSLERENDELFTMAVNIDTDSFDSTIFQREVYGQNNTVGSITIESLQSSGLDSSTLDDNDEEDGAEVSFIAEIEIPIDAVPYVPRRVTEPVSETVSAEEINEDSVPNEERAEEVNQNEL